jgi:hypothetical protein
MVDLRKESENGISAVEDRRRLTIKIIKYTFLIL